MPTARARSAFLATTVGFALAACGCRAPIATNAVRANVAASLGSQTDEKPSPVRPSPLPRHRGETIERVHYSEDSPPAQPDEAIPLEAPHRDEAGELSLEETIDVAWAANPDLVSASQQVALAEATLARARAEFFPKLGFSESYMVSNNPVNAFTYQLNQAQLSLMQDFNNPGTLDDFDTQLRLEHRLYAGGRRSHQVHAADAQVAAGAFHLKTVRNQLVLRVAEAYYRLLQARDLVKVREEAVAQVEQHLEIVESRFRNESAVKSDVLTVEVRLAEVREALITAENQLQLAWVLLSNVVGTRVGPRPLPANIPPAPWQDHVTQVQAAVDEALDARPEIHAFANRRQAASEQLLVAETGKRPDVDLVADYDVHTGDFRAGNDSFFVGVVFRLNLLDGGRTRAEIRQAEARLREIEAREQRLMLDIELDVHRAYLQLNEAQARLKVTEQAVVQAQESLREIEVRYRGQAAPITELVDSQVALSDARVRRTNAMADLEIARVALEAAMGRLAVAIAY
jgi:outer membrane protein TolC